MPKCSFSGKEIAPGTGKMFVRDDGTVLWFRTSKEEKNYLKLKRDPRKFKWTTFFEKGVKALKSKKKK